MGVKQWLQLDSSDKNKREMTVLAILILAIIVFYPILSTGKPTEDDIDAYMTGISKVDRINTAVTWAKESGRLILAFYLQYVPYLIDNVLYFKFFQIGSVILNYLLFLYAIHRLLKSPYFTAFLAIFFLTALQDGNDRNLLSSYPFMFHIGFDFVLIALVMFINYIEKPQRKYLILSAVFILCATFVYEMFMPYFVVFVFMAYFYRNQISLPVENKLLKIIYVSSPFIILIALRVVSYAAFRYYFPSAYGGAQISENFNLKGFFMVFYQFSIASLPTYIFFHLGWLFDVHTSAFTGHSYDLSYLVQSARAEWIVKAVVSVWLVYKLLSERQAVFNSFRNFALVILLALLLVFSPCLSVGLSMKYQEEVLYGYKIEYTSTYFSFFGTALLLTALILYLNQIISRYAVLSKMYVITICVIVALISLRTDYSNYYVARALALDHFKWKTMDQFLQMKEFNELPDNSLIYAPSLDDERITYDRYQQESYWSGYFGIKTGKEVNVLLNREKLLEALGETTVTPDNLYFLKYAQESKDFNQFIVFAKVDEVAVYPDIIYFYANKVTLFSYSKNRRFLVFGSLKGGSTHSDLIIDDNPIGKIEGNFFAHVMDKGSAGDPLVKIEISSNNLNLDSIALSYYTNNIETRMYFTGIRATFGPDFYDFEGTPEDNVRWCGRQGTLVLENISEADKEVTIAMDIATAHEEPANLTITGPDFEDRIKISSEATAYNKTLNIPTNSSIELRFASDAQRVDIPGESRELVFMLNNLKIIEDKAPEQ